MKFSKEEIDWLKDIVKDAYDEYLTQSDEIDQEPETIQMYESLLQKITSMST